MHSSPELVGAVVAAAEALRAGRAAARRLSCPPCVPLQRKDGTDPGLAELAHRFSCG